MDDAIERFYKLAMDNYDTWGNWEIECNERDEWEQIINEFGDTDAGRTKWVKFCEGVLDARQEAGWDGVIFNESYKHVWFDASGRPFS